MIEHVGATQQFHWDLRMRLRDRDFQSVILYQIAITSRFETSRACGSTAGRKQGATSPFKLEDLQMSC